MYYKRSDAHFDLDPRDIWADAANDLYNYEDSIDFAFFHHE